uniref:SRP40_C domain-containing protein n=1 Tax=Globodera pallida TaxID=36090 RepID=A0A183BT75_GLOPA
MVNMNGGEPQINSLTLKFEEFRRVSKELEEGLKIELMQKDRKISELEALSVKLGGVAKTVPVPKTKPKPVSESSSSDDDVPPTKAPLVKAAVTQQKTVPVPKTKPKPVSESSSSDDDVPPTKALRIEASNQEDTWGKRAANDFNGVTGKRFRHEKTKKKRGSYNGGQINTSVKSMKFAQE